MLKNNRAVLLHMDLFIGIDEKDVAVMLNCLNPRAHRFSRGEFIAVAGDEFSGLGILLCGSATVSKEDFSGNRLVMSVITAGDIFGEMVVFSKHNKWPATIQAQDSCEVIFLQRNKILGECEQLCSWHRRMIQNFLGIVSERALMLHKKVEYLMFKSIRGKLCAYLLDQYREKGSKSFLLQLNRNELADFLNVSRPSLSREMGKLRNEGAIDYYLSSIKIIDADALAGGVSRDA